jgi:hypothetical protein
MKFGIVYNSQVLYRMPKNLRKQNVCCFIHSQAFIKFWSLRAAIVKYKLKMWSRGKNPCPERGQFFYTDVVSILLEIHSILTHMDCPWRLNCLQLPRKFPIFYGRMFLILFVECVRTIKEKLDNIHKKSSKEQFLKLRELKGSVRIKELLCTALNIPVCLMNINEVSTCCAGWTIHSFLPQSLALQ